MPPASPVGTSTRTDRYFIARIRRRPENQDLLRTTAESTLRPSIGVLQCGVLCCWKPQPAYSSLLNWGGMNKPGFKAPSFHQSRKQLPKTDFKAKRTTLRTKAAHLAPEEHLGRSVRGQKTQLHASSSRLLCAELFHNVELLVHIVLLTNVS